MQNKESNFECHVFDIDMETQFTQSDDKILLSAVQVAEGRQASRKVANSMAHSQLSIEVCIKFLLCWEVG